MNVPKKNTPCVLPQEVLTKSTHNTGAAVVSTILAQQGQKGQSLQGNQVVCSGIDTLELTIGGMVSPSQYLLDNYELWEEVKSSYVPNTEYPTIEMNGKWWILYPTGSGSYCFRLRNDEIGFIHIFHPKSFNKGCIGKQQIHLKLYSSFIHSVSEKELLDRIYSIISNFISNPSDSQVLISRVDLHTDITMNEFFNYEELNNSVTRARFKDRWIDTNEIIFNDEEEDFLESASRPPTYNREVSKLIDTYKENYGEVGLSNLINKMSNASLNQSTIGPDRIIENGNKVETAYFGNPKSADVYCRMYDKTAEVKKKKAEYLKEIWINNGYNGKDLVGRIEYSMQRKFLKDIDNGSYVNLTDFLKNKHKIWEYLTHKWLKMVSVKKKNNIQLSPLTNLWKKIQSAFTIPVSLVSRKKNYNARYTQLFSQALGCIKQAASLGMVDNTDRLFVKETGIALLDNLLSSYHNGEIMDRRKLLGIA